jgi:hypothetical protein
LPKGEYVVCGLYSKYEKPQPTTKLKILGATFILLTWYGLAMALPSLAAVMIASATF